MEIVVDAAYAILCQDSRFSGVFAIDEAVLKAQGISNFSKYSCNPAASPKDLATDLFVKADYDYCIPDKMKQVFLPSSKL